MGREDLRAIVNTPEFQRALRRYDKDSLEHRSLKGLERAALGITREQERRQRRMASVNNPRQSQQHKETGNGSAQHVSL